MMQMLFLNYSTNLKIIRNITPGTPKNPAISEVTMLIPITNPKCIPIKLTRNNSIVPSTAFIINLINILSGHANNLTTINKAIMAIKKYPTYSIPSSPIDKLFYILFVYLHVKPICFYI